MADSGSKEQRQEIEADGPAAPDSDAKRPQQKGSVGFRLWKKGGGGVGGGGKEAKRERPSDAVKLGCGGLFRRRPKKNQQPEAAVAAEPIEKPSKSSAIKAGVVQVTEQAEGKVQPAAAEEPAQAAASKAMQESGGAQAPEPSIDTLPNVPEANGEILTEGDEAAATEKGRVPPPRPVNPPGATMPKAPLVELAREAGEAKEKLVEDEKAEEKKLEENVEASKKVEVDLEKPKMEEQEQKRADDEDKNAEQEKTEHLGRKSEVKAEEEDEKIEQPDVTAEEKAEQSEEKVEEKATKEEEAEAENGQENEKSEEAASRRHSSAEDNEEELAEAEQRFKQASVDMSSVTAKPGVTIEQSPHTEMWSSIVNKSFVGTGVFKKAAVCSLTTGGVLACNPADFTPTVNQAAALRDNFNDRGAFSAAGFGVADTVYQLQEETATKEVLCGADADHSQAVLVFRTNTALVAAVCTERLDRAMQMLVDMREHFISQGM